MKGIFSYFPSQKGELKGSKKEVTIFLNYLKFLKLNYYGNKL